MKDKEIIADNLKEVDRIDEKKESEKQRQKKEQMEVM